MVTESNRDISFVIERYLGVLSESQNGWKKELNLVSWNGKPAKLDLREWSPDHQRMAKGVTLRHEEARALQRALYRWLTGYGKQADAPAPVSDMVVEPETGEILDTASDLGTCEEAAVDFPQAEDSFQAADCEIPAEEPAAEEAEQEE